MAEKGRSAVCYGDGSDLRPLQPISVSEIKDFDSMARAMELTSFGGRNVGRGTDVLHQMVSDKNCFRVLTLAGAMTPAQMGVVICDIIEMGFHCIISTGALLSHGFV
jgi:deoxyhypusine synthase